MDDIDTRSALQRTLDLFTPEGSCYGAEWDLNLQDAIGCVVETETPISKEDQAELVQLANDLPWMVDWETPRDEDLFFDFPELLEKFKAMPTLD